MPDPESPRHEPSPVKENRVLSAVVIALCLFTIVLMLALSANALKTDAVYRGF